MELVELRENAMMIWERLCLNKKPLTAKRKKEIIARLKKQKHKSGVNPNDWDKVNSDLLLIAEFDLNLCEGLGLYVEYTSIIRPKIPGVSVSDSHADKRAYDRTLRNWPTDDTASWFAELVNDGLTVGAVSRSDGKEREAVFEEDEFNKHGKQVKWKHLHFQCRR
jgi:hypothetical protein